MTRLHDYIVVETQSEVSCLRTQGLNSNRSITSDKHQAIAQSGLSGSKKLGSNLQGTHKSIYLTILNSCYFCPIFTLTGIRSSSAMKYA